VKGALALVQEAMGVGPDRVLSLAGAQESRATAACSQRAERELGYRPRVSLQEGIRRQVAAARGSHAPEHLLALS
jgi:nucleoside-diphosphate-sugar epimerase